MRASTLTGRVAFVQTLVTVAALAIVALGTSVAVHALLTWKTDQQLDSVLTRVTAYLSDAPPQAMNWPWLEAEIEEVRPRDVRIEVRDTTGRLWVAAGSGAPLTAARAGCSSLGVVRGCSVVHGQLSIQAARDRSDDLAVRRQLTLALVAACALAGVVVAAGSRAVTRRAVRPLSELAARVAAIEPGTGRRAGSDTNLAELAGLASRFDDLVERFEAALAREKRFAAEASHELRTPLTVARAEIESLARGEPDPGAVERALASVDRLGALVEALLWFARAQARLDHERMDLVNLADLVRAELALMQQVCAACSFVSELPDEALVRGDEHLLGRAVANLLDNALKHGDKVVISVRILRVMSQVELRVLNGGAVLPAELREQVFLPFFRAPGAPVRAAGFGLGLPFARAVARAHGGDVRVGDALNQTEMVLQLPLVEWSAASLSPEVSPFAPEAEHTAQVLGDA